jgi:8-oxo-dGTP diphosphatase
MEHSLPQVGVAVIIMREGFFLLGKRAGSLGAGTWALPGGHLDFGESVEECAAREVMEETGLVIEGVVPGPYTNTVFTSEGKHDVTLFVTANCPVGEPRLREPDKCSLWHWFRWSELPRPLFQPLASLVHAGFVPSDLR